MAKLVMVGEDHLSKRLDRVGSAIEKKLDILKTKKFIVLAEGPFLTVEERISLNSEVMLAPTAELLTLFRQMHGREFDRVLAGEEKRYLEERKLGKFRVNIESIESPVFLLIPQILEIGLLERISDFEKEALGAFSRLMKAVVYNWKDSAFNESMILAEYAGALDLTIKLRDSLNYTEGRLPSLNILRMSEDGEENTRIFSRFPPDMYEDIMQLISKISFTFRSRSIMHAEKISAVAEKKRHDVIFAVTGAMHIPDILDILPRNKLLEKKEAVFTESHHDSYSRLIRDPEVIISMP